LSAVERGTPIGVAVLGSTGSVGTQALDVIASMPERFSVVALAASRVSPLLEAQSRRFRPEIVAVSNEPEGWAGTGAIESGADALALAALHPAAEIVIVATSGHAAMGPTFRAVDAGKTIALANKETIVCAGEILMPLALTRGAPIRPVDSEHSAVWQCLAGTPPAAVARLVLTASGGPFRSLGADELARVTVDQTLAHPTWAMGGKITVDSASLMNKGLEVIEARWLFDVRFDRIEVVVHPESIVHSLVEFVDGSMLAQLGLPDMRLPIQYALTYPERLPSPCPRLSLVQTAALHFEAPDLARFRPSPSRVKPVEQGGRTRLRSAPPMRWRWRPSSPVACGLSTSQQWWRMFWQRTRLSARSRLSRSPKRTHGLDGAPGTLSSDGVPILLIRSRYQGFPELQVPGEGGRVDLANADSGQRRRARCQRGARGHHVVDQHNAVDRVPERGARVGLERADDVGPPASRIEPNLARRRPRAAE
jgi:1-deoxy-D-xylulose-5-phosphate reductoisomerase